MSDEQEAQYTVTFVGPAKNDLTNVNKLVEGLKKRFKLSDEAVTQMMRRAPVAIKAGATLSEAEKYKVILEAIGAKVQVEPVEDVQEESQPPEESPPPPDQEPQTVAVQEKTAPPSPETAPPQEAEPQATEESTTPLDREPQVIPVKAKTPPPPPKTGGASDTQAEVGEQMVKCPQCGYVQEQTDECMKCGVIISKFLKYQEEVKPPGAERVGPAPAGVPAAEPQVQKIIGTPMEEPSGYTPWEDMANLGFFAAFFRTLTGVLFSAFRFFREMPVNKNIHHSLIYGIIMGFFVALSALLWQFALSGISGQTEGMEGMNALFAPFFFIIYALLLPFLIAYGLFVMSGILHTALMLVGGNRKGLDATFRVVAYTQSTQIFFLLPLLGVLIYLVYTPILLAIGFKESHQISTGKAVAAVLLPVLVAVALGTIIAIMFGSLILSLIPQMMQQQQPPGF